MTIYDQELAEIIKEGIPVEISGNQYTIEPSRGGSCNGCYFQNGQCPQRAVTYCTSNGGNILKLVEPKK